MHNSSTPYGIRTRVTGVKGQRPRPLDERGQTGEPASEQHRPSIATSGTGIRASPGVLLPNVHTLPSSPRGTVPAMTRPRRVLGAAGMGYLIGMFPSADLAAGLAGGADLRHEGTGNPGALNVSHILGKKWGVAVSAVDVGKGVVAARVGQRLAGDVGANVASTSAVVGHCFPTGRTGGKGVATSIGQVIGTFPAYLPVDLVVGAATSALPWFRQRTRTAAAVASVVWVGCATLWWKRGLPNPGGVTPTVALPLAAAVSSVMIAVRFRAETDQVDAFNRQQNPDEGTTP